jgi:hypothetical protein
MPKTLPILNFEFRRHANAAEATCIVCATSGIFHLLKRTHAGIRKFTCGKESQKSPCDSPKAEVTCNLNNIWQNREVNYG